MTRPEARDTVRTAAEIPGDDVFNHLINLYFDQEIRKLTAIRRYTEAMVIREKVTTWSLSTEHGQFAQLPDMQHLNEDEIYFAEDDDLTQLRHLTPWNRLHTNITGDLPLYFRVGREDVGAVNLNVLYVYPQEGLVTGTDFLYIDYWKPLVWESDLKAFPIKAIEAIVIDKVIERIASLQKSGLAKRHAMLAKEAYIASRGQNI